jgi:hypothetical protein
MLLVSTRNSVQFSPLKHHSFFLACVNIMQRETTFALETCIIHVLSASELIVKRRGQLNWVKIARP